MNGSEVAALPRITIDVLNWTLIHGPAIFSLVTGKDVVSVCVCVQEAVVG